MKITEIKFELTPCNEILRYEKVSNEVGIV